jgi:hypothetical protein
MAYGFEFQKIFHFGELLHYLLSIVTLKIDASTLEYPRKPCIAYLMGYCFFIHDFGSNLEGPPHFYMVLRMIMGDVF